MEHHVNIASYECRVSSGHVTDAGQRLAPGNLWLVGGLDLRFVFGTADSQLGSQISVKYA